MDSLQDKMSFANKVRKAIVEFKRNELIGEIFTPLTVQTVLLMLNHTNTATTSGLDCLQEV